MALTTILPSGLNSANDFSSLVPSAYSTANAAFLQANAAFLQANNSTDAWVRTQANNAYDTANSSFLKANASYTAQNTTASFANGSFDKANSAGSFANGAFLVANSAASFSNGAFLVANSAASFSNGAFDRANAAYTQANNSTDTWVRTQANNAYDTANSAASFANGAFTKANNALANTTGTFNGELSLTGKLNLIASAGDEGGELFLAQPQSNTSLSGGVTIDVYQNKLRIFEQGGSARGAYIDLSAASAGVGSDLLSGGGGGTTDTTARVSAQAAFDKANSAGSFANGAFTKANNAFANTTGTFNGDLSVTGIFKSLNSVGSEGGEIQLATAASGTTLTAGTVTIDIYGDTVRIFETGGTNRGAYINLAAAGTAVSTNLMSSSGGTTDSWARDTANASFLTANSGASFANAAYAHANAAYTAANTGGGGGGADTWAREQANAAFLKANTEILIFAVTDDTSNVTVGASRASFRAPSAMTLTSIPRASLNVASTSGVVTCDIKLNGTTILGANKLSIDATEKTSTTAATPTTLATTSISDDAEITVDVTAAGTGAKGLKITLYYTD